VDPLRLQTIALGYLRAHKRLEDAYNQAFVNMPNKPSLGLIENVWIELFEALNWLDALTSRPEAIDRMDADLREALRFVRGLVHHRFEIAIEFREDVLVPGFDVLMLGWCWRETSSLAGTRRLRAGQRAGQHAYERTLAGRSVGATLREAADVAARMYAGVG
jgi:hypothetical protein